MSMVTRCPSCATAFRVTPAHLQARGGQVRCGRCATVFDGFRALATLPDVTPPEPQKAAHAADATPAPARVAPVPDAAAIETVTTPEQEPETVASAGPSDSAPAGGGPSPTELDWSEITAPAAPASAPDDPDATPPSAEAGAVPEEAPPAAPEPVAQRADLAALLPAEAPPRRRAWGALAVLAVLALGVQAVYFYRSELASEYPALRPALGQLCGLAGCKVVLPQRPKQINIEASDLQAPDPSRPGLIVLTATLRNHAGIDVGYPALDVVLTNVKDHTLARRIVLPAEYLEAGRDPLAGIPANAEFTVRINLDTGDLGAAGFRLDLLAAPAP